MTDDTENFVLFFRCDDGIAGKFYPHLLEGSTALSTEEMTRGLGFALK